MAIHGRKNRLYIRALRLTVRKIRVEVLVMRTLICFLLVALPSQRLLAKGTDFKITALGQLFKVEARPKSGFNYPFFLYIPTDSLKMKNLLVVPNNTGSSITDFELQTLQTRRQTLVEASLAERISAVLLVPDFPRPDVDPPIYTHSLSRSTLLAKEGSLKRIDLQVIKMTEAARDILKKEYKITLRKKLFFSGFSAAAMFANRFAFIHPNLVAGVAIGAPGGWPLAPLTNIKEQALTYPVGISDIAELTGKPTDLEALKKVHFLFYIGAKDENDSVVYRDSYTKEQEALVFSVFGKNPVERWPIAEKLYTEAGLKAQFKLYKNLGHESDQTTRNDVVEFFKAVPTE